tara:strand:- start:63555 stop:64085 length:531 start_codon:yes stop_codon:yes gene_type:complete
MVNPRFGFLLCVLLLVACSQEDSKTELEAYVQQVKARKSADIEPLPQITPYETFVYQASSMRSPFTLPEPNRQVVNEVADNGIRPNVTRRRELLETYPIDSLSMMGTLEKGGKIWAVIIDKDGAVHRVTKGNYVGLNHGKIKKITEEKLYIDEIVANPVGGWQERQSEMALSTETE